MPWTPHDLPKPANAGLAPASAGESASDQEGKNAARRDNRDPDQQIAADVRAKADRPGVAGVLRHRQQRSRSDRIYEEEPQRLARRAHRARQHRDDEEAHCPTQQEFQRHPVITPLLQMHVPTLSPLAPGVPAS